MGGHHTKLVHEGTESLWVDDRDFSRIVYIEEGEIHMYTIREKRGPYSINPFALFLICARIVSMRKNILRYKDRTNEQRRINSRCYR